MSTKSIVYSREELELLKKHHENLKCSAATFALEHINTWPGKRTLASISMMWYNRQVYLERLKPKPVVPPKTVVFPLSERILEKTVEELLVEILNELKILNSFAGQVKKP